MGAKVNEQYHGKTLNSIIHAKKVLCPSNQLAKEKSKKAFLDPGILLNEVTGMFCKLSRNNGKVYEINFLIIGHFPLFA